MSNKIKIKLLRDIKTDSLLIYIRTILEEHLKKIERKEYKIDIGFEEYNKEILENISNLTQNLKKHIINSDELKSFILTEQKKRARLLPDDEALIYYYNNIVKEIERNLTEGELWIPEQVIFSLLCEWVVEEGKSLYFYPFLGQIDYIKILAFYEEAREKEENEDLKKNILKMYQLSSSVIKKLKTLKYKINPNRKSKDRKRNKR